MSEGFREHHEKLVQLVYEFENGQEVIRPIGLRELFMAEEIERLREERITKSLSEVGSELISDVIDSTFVLSIEVVEAKLISAKITPEEYASFTKCLGEQIIKELNDLRANQAHPASDETLEVDDE